MIEDIAETLFNITMAIFLFCVSVAILAGTCTGMLFLYKLVSTNFSLGG